MKPPLHIEVRRGGIPESTHQVHGIALDADGRTIASWGDIKRITFSRSSLKPIQALPLIETGAADKFHLTDKEIALAAASHNAEPDHVALARSWMNKIGLAEGDLECGWHWPYDKASEHALCAAGQKPCTLHNNCSGKHLGMVTACLHQGWPVKGYTKPVHPLQQMILSSLADLSGVNSDQMVIGIDGCTAPNPALPLEKLAQVFVKLMERPAGILILQAMSQNPFYVGGTNRLDTDLMQSNPSLVSKGGAEGNLVVFNLPLKSALYLKCEDGNSRATSAAAGKILYDLGWVSDDAAFAEHTRPQFKNWRGIITGDITVRTG